MKHIKPIFLTYWSWSWVSLNTIWLRQNNFVQLQCGATFYFYQILTAFKKLKIMSEVQYMCAVCKLWLHSLRNWKVFNIAKCNIRLLITLSWKCWILYNYCTWTRSIWGFMEQSTTILNETNAELILLYSAP